MLHPCWSLSSSYIVCTNLVTSLLRRVDPTEARGEFIFFFFGGSGAFGIGAAQVSKLVAQFNALKSLGGARSRGGEDVRCNPLATVGYPEQLKSLDIEHIIQNIPSTDTISAAGTKKSYMSQLGYLERQGFYDCYPDENPLALCAVFDALSGGGGDLVAPQTFSATSSNWLTRDSAGKFTVDIDQFKVDLLQSSLKKYSAFAVFFLLIALVLDLIVESGINAFL